MGVLVSLISYIQNITGNAPLPTAYPFTVGMWVRPANPIPEDSDLYWALYNSPLSAAYFITATATGGFRFDTVGGGSAATTEQAQSGEWHYLLARAISATNRRLMVLFPNGVTEEAVDTTSVSFIATLIRLDIGNLTGGGLSSSNILGVAEYFITNTDVQGDGAATQPQLLRQLAFGGPFSVNRVIPGVLYYESFRRGGSNIVRRQNIEDTFSARIPSSQDWTAVSNGGQIGEHPPLPAIYRQPTPNPHVMRYT